LNINKPTRTAECAVRQWQCWCRPTSLRCGMWNIPVWNVKHSRSPAANSHVHEFCQGRRHISIADLVRQNLRRKSRPCWLDVVKSILKSRKQYSCLVIVLMTVTAKGLPLIFRP